MKKITLHSDTKEKLVNGVVAKIKEVLKEYLDDDDIDNNFNPNYAITIHSKDRNIDYSFIIRVSRGGDPNDGLGVSYFVHLSYGFEEDEQRTLNTVNIIKYNKHGDQTYLWRQILENVDCGLYMGCHDAVIEVYNEKTYRTIKYVVTEDDPELSSIDTFIDNCIIDMIDNYITENNPTLHLYFEYELRNGIKMTINEKDFIYVNIQKLDDHYYAIYGRLPSARFDSGRDYSTYHIHHDQMKDFLLEYLKQLFNLRNAMFYDEHMKVSIVMRSVHQYKIVL